MAFRAKFRLATIARHDHCPESRELTFRTVCADKTEENRRFSKYTPSGAMAMPVDNPNALARPRLNQHFYPDFTEVPEG